MPAGVLVLGDGGWGTALAILAVRSGHRVKLWGHDPAYTAHIARTRRNPKFLPGVDVPASVEVRSDLGALLPGTEVVLSVIPTQFLRSALTPLGPGFPPRLPVVSCSKGLEKGTLLRPSQVLEQVLGPRTVVVLSGPSHAEEVARGLPASVVAAALEPGPAREVSALLSGPTFRVYTNPDPLGVEIAAAVKNIIALAAGIADGLGLGDSARAALITRGVAEVSRLGRALGGRRETFTGLAGVGDLIVTCTSLHSRNRGVGYRIGSGETLELVLRSSEKVPEGVETTRAVHELARRLGVQMPITEEVHAVLFEEKPALEAVQSLMARSAKDEMEDLPEP